MRLFTHALLESNSALGTRAGRAWCAYALELWHPWAFFLVFHKVLPRQALHAPLCALSVSHLEESCAQFVAPVAVGWEQVHVHPLLGARQVQAWLWFSRTVQRVGGRGFWRV